MVIINFFWAGVIILVCGGGVVVVVFCEVKYSIVIVGKQSMCSCVGDLISSSRGFSCFFTAVKSDENEQ